MIINHHILSHLCLKGTIHRCINYCIILFISFQSISRYITNFEKRLNKPSQHSGAKQVIKINDVTYAPLLPALTYAEEQELVLYLIKQSKVNNKLTKEDICHLTCAFFSDKGIKLPYAWKANDLFAMKWVKIFILRNGLSSLLPKDNCVNSLQETKEDEGVKSKEGMIIHPGWYFCADGKVRSNKVIIQTINKDHSYALEPCIRYIEKQGTAAFFIITK